MRGTRFIGDPLSVGVALPQVVAVVRTITPRSSKKPMGRGGKDCRQRRRLGRRSRMAAAARRACRTVPRPRGAPTADSERRAPGAMIDGWRDRNRRRHVDEARHYLESERGEGGVRRHGAVHRERAGRVGQERDLDRSRRHRWRHDQQLRSRRGSAEIGRVPRRRHQHGDGQLERNRHGDRQRAGRHSAGFSRRPSGRDVHRPDGDHATGGFNGAASYGLTDVSFSPATPEGSSMSPSTSWGSTSRRTPARPGSVSVIRPTRARPRRSTTSTTPASPWIRPTASISTPPKGFAAARWASGARPTAGTARCVRPDRTHRHRM